jgi:hypothetical protein
MWKSDDSAQLALIVAALAGVGVTIIFMLLARRKKPVPQNPAPTYTRGKGYW